jgi:regulator of protease activity HflC (stomatin/prohibitin superfamily)
MQDEQYDEDIFPRAEIVKRPRRKMPWGSLGGATLVMIATALVVGGYITYSMFRIEVPIRHMAVLTRKVGEDMSNGMEIAPDVEGMYYKGVQERVLGEGRFYYNPYLWDWEVVPQIEIPQSQLGVRVRLYGDDLPPEDVIAWNATEKGIVPEVLRPGRYAINAIIKGERSDRENYAEYIELHDPIVIPAGFKGVVSNLAAPMPEDPNVLLVEDGRRGVQQDTLSPQTAYVNPYVQRIHLVDCRSQRFNLSEGGEMGFPSEDGFWVSLDGIIEFRVNPDEAAHVYVTYNDESNGDRIDEEIVKKIILPNARAFCRLRGSQYTGVQFITGETRIEFQAAFQDALAKTCRDQGIEIIQALITKIRPPEKIADPVRKRQIALQEEGQYQQEILQQGAEQQLAEEQQLVLQKQAVVAAQRDVVQVVTEAKQMQEVALIEASQRLKVAEFQLEAAEDEAAAVLALGRADADVIQFDNQAVAAGWAKSVLAFDGDGDEFARWTMFRKLAPAFKGMMINTSDSPIMDIFESYEGNGVPRPVANTAGTE